MSVWQVMGIGEEKIFAQNRAVQGKVTAVKKCWWLKVNTKAVRFGPTDGAEFPHIIYFTYTVCGQTYQGKRYINWNKRCPVVGERLTVYFEKNDPAKYAVIL